VRDTGIEVDLRHDPAIVVDLRKAVSSCGDSFTRQHSYVQSFAVLRRLVGSKIGSKKDQTMTRAKRGFAQVTQQRSGRYAVRYSLPSGKRVSAGKTFTRKADAEAWAADRRREIARGKARGPEKITFTTYAATWLAGRHVAGRPIKPRTRAHYQALLDGHLLPTFGNRQLGAITPKDVRAWHAVTLADKPTMRAHAYSLLRTIFASAVTDDLLDANPARITGAGRVTRVHKVKPASVTEIGALAAAMPDRLQLAVLLASWCALRFGETVELRRGDVDLGAEVIRIRRAAVRVKQDFHEQAGKYACEVGTPKSDASIRDVTIPPHLVPVIEGASGQTRWRQT
jgi:integrase